ncbi:MAG: hypothetical protein ACREO5_11930 [Candidatus Binatia bacterium]
MSYLCLCGHVIKNNVYPCAETGDLKWQTESENASTNSYQALKEFFAAIENGKKDEEFFRIGENNLNFDSIDQEGTRKSGQIDATKYLTREMATSIHSIMTHLDGDEGHSVYRCHECKRIYIQKEYCSDEYACYEKRQDYRRT